MFENRFTNSAEYNFSIAADATWSACCLDFNTANHYFTDCVIHFGEACLCPCSKLPNFYIFDCLGSEDFSDIDIVNIFEEIIDDFRNQENCESLTIIYDPEYAELSCNFEKTFFTVSILFISRLTFPRQNKSVSIIIKIYVKINLPWYYFFNFLAKKHTQKLSIYHYHKKN